MEIWWDTAWVGLRLVHLFLYLFVNVLCHATGVIWCVCNFWFSVKIFTPENFRHVNIFLVTLLCPLLYSKPTPFFFPQNFYTAPYLERGQEESSPIGINGHSTLERKATKPFSNYFWPYVKASSCYIWSKRLTC